MGIAYLGAKIEGGSITTDAAGKGGGGVDPAGNGADGVQADPFDFSKGI